MRFASGKCLGPTLARTLSPDRSKVGLIGPWTNGRLVRMQLSIAGRYHVHIMSRASRPAKLSSKSSSAAPPALAAKQMDMFPEQPVVERLDPIAVVGPRTGATAVIRVRMRGVESTHLVFHDRHGWYCETHGAACEAVSVARDSQHDHNP